MREEKRERKVILIVFLIVDRLTKHFFKRFFSATVNQGISFGLFPSLALVMVLISIFGLVFFSPKKNSFFWWMILLGGLSNLADRLIFGGVIDFINLPGIPSFNLADIIIVTGAIFLLVDLVRNQSL